MKQDGIFWKKLRVLSAALLFGLGGAATAQTLTQKVGDATEVDYLEQARTLSMRNVYARSLYAHILANPSVFQNQSFYVNYLIFLMHQDENFSCENAFSSEFERRDFFTQAFTLQSQLAQIISGVTIPERFDVAYSVPTGEYDFSSASLALSGSQAFGLSQQLSGSITAQGVSGRGIQSCATQILRGTNVDTQQFPWSFNLVNEAGENRQPGFPFSSALQLSDTDARQLFERFGRQLYAIVSYQVRAANDGSRKIQVVATDGQLFGLSSDAVVRVKSYAHPTASRPNYLDFKNPIELIFNDLGTTMDLTFQQQGFRAVGSGTRLGSATDFTAATTLPVTGSSAVGNSGFIIRLSSPQLLDQLPEYSSLRRRGLQGQTGYLTIYGSVDFEGITSAEAPVSGVYVVQTINPETGALEAAQPLRFTGRFKAPGAQDEAPTEPATPSSQLDELVIDEPTDTTDAQQPPNPEPAPVE